MSDEEGPITQEEGQGEADVEPQPEEQTEEAGEQPEEGTGEPAEATEEPAEPEGEEQPPVDEPADGEDGPPEPQDDQPGEVVPEDDGQSTVPLSTEQASTTDRPPTEAPPAEAGPEPDEEEEEEEEQTTEREDGTGVPSEAVGRGMSGGSRVSHHTGSDTRFSQMDGMTGGRFSVGTPSTARGDDQDTPLDDLDEIRSVESGDQSENDDISDDDDNEMVVLDPNHPLMNRFQKALKNLLTRQEQKATFELRELEEAVKTKKKDREDIGVQLYGLQQELARYQMILEKFHDNYNDLHQNRMDDEDLLERVRDMFRSTQMNILQQRQKSSELQTEVENLATRLFYMVNAKEDIRSDIAVMRRAAEKAGTEVTQAEGSKLKQDLYVDRLVETLESLKEKIAMHEAQHAAQSEETKAAKAALTEAQLEIESIELEKKQLYQQWNSSLIGMRRRDEAHAAMQEAISQQMQRVMNLEQEIEAYKKSVAKAQEENENLTILLNRTLADINMVKKLTASSQQAQEQLKQEFMTYSRTLQETEQALNRSSTDKQVLTNEMNALRKQIEREYLEKVKLEDAIMEKIREQLTLDKAAQYTKKVTDKMRKRTKDLESNIADVENAIAKESLDLSNVTTRIKRLAQTIDSMNDDIQKKNELISKSESEINKRNAVIERKQGIIDQLNKKIEQLKHEMGGEETGPQEIEIKSIQKAIDMQNLELTEMQQQWLRQQHELVKMSKERDVQFKDVDMLKKQLTILSQKKIRVENEISGHKNETNDIERNIRNFQNDMTKLNVLLTKNKYVQENLQQNNILVENDFIQTLRDAERQSIKMQDNVESLQEEKERLLNSLVEAERQIMLWEKKTQILKETRAAIDSEAGQGEIRAMKAEIHRMQVRFEQLMRQQEKMIQDMEKAVSRRDTIITRGEAQSKMNKKVLTKGTLEKQLHESRKKMKKLQIDCKDCDGEITGYREQQQQLSQDLEGQQSACKDLEQRSDNLDSEVDHLIEERQRYMQDLISLQQKAKNYQALKDGKYQMLCKTEAGLDNEMKKQSDRLHAMTNIVDRLNQEYPHLQPALRKVTMTLRSRGQPIDDL